VRLDVCFALIDEAMDIPVSIITGKRWIAASERFMQMFLMVGK
jgi:hypothetical protein